MGQLVKGRILRYVPILNNLFAEHDLLFSLDSDSKRVEMSFRSGDLSRASNGSKSLADLEEGQQVEGVVKKVEDYGLFIEIDGTKLSGLCHKSEVRIPVLL